MNKKMKGQYDTVNKINKNQMSDVVQQMYTKLKVEPEMKKFEERKCLFKNYFFWFFSLILITCDFLCFDIIMSPTLPLLRFVRIIHSLRIKVDGNKSGVTFINVTELC